MPGGPLPKSGTTRGEGVNTRTAVGGGGGGSGYLGWIELEQAAVNDAIFFLNCAC